MPVGIGAHDRKERSLSLAVAGLAVGGVADRGRAPGRAPRSTRTRTPARTPAPPTWSSTCRWTSRSARWCRSRSATSTATAAATTPARSTPSCAQQVLGTDAVGSILSGGGDVPGAGLLPEHAADLGRRRSTRWRSTRSTTPRTTSRSSTAPTWCTATTTSLGTTLFPQQIGLGSSFDPALVTAVQKLGRPGRRGHQRALGLRPGRRRRHELALGPLLRVLRRGPGARRRRWPRPRSRACRVAGTVASTVKHFAGYGASDSGLDRTPADMSLRTFQTYQLPSYEKAIDSGALSGDGQLRRRSTASRPPARSTCSPRCCASSSASPA